MPLTTIKTKIKCMYGYSSKRINSILLTASKAAAARLHACTITSASSKYIFITVTNNISFDHKQTNERTNERTNEQTGSPFAIDTDDGSDRLNCTANVIVGTPLFKTDYSGHTKTFTKVGWFLMSNNDPHICHIRTSA